MSDLVRFSASIEGELLDRFDQYCKTGSFATRSEAIRQIFNEALTKESWANDSSDAAATLTLVYDHHRANLMDQMVEIQHEHVDIVVSTTHIHLDHDNCLEVIILRGRASEIQSLASKLQGLKGIKQGGLVMAKAEGAKSHHHHHHSHGHSHSH
jgi:CopG family nickel-responsive transcriptional regulator